MEDLALLVIWNFTDINWRTYSYVFITRVARFLWEDTGANKHGVYSVLRSFSNKNENKISSWSAVSNEK